MEQVHDRIWRIPSEHQPGRFTNVYIVRGTRTAMIDTGVLGTPTRDVAPVLDGLGLALSDVDEVINTHGHYDHMGGNSEMADAGAPIALHGNDLWRAQSNEAQGDEARAMFDTIGYPEEGEPLEAAVLGLLGREVAVDRLLEDGDRIDLGGGVELLVVHTPGHTVGSVSLLWEAEGVLVTGDSFQGRYPKRLPVLQDRSEPGREIHSYLDEIEMGLVIGAGGQNPATRGTSSNSALAILLGGGADAASIAEGENIALAVRQRQVKEYVQRVRVAGSGDRFENGRANAALSDYVNA